MVSLLLLVSNKVAADNEIYLDQLGDNAEIILIQQGHNNEVFLLAYGETNKVSTAQGGHDNNIDLRIDGSNISSEQIQGGTNISLDLILDGDGHEVYTTQLGNSHEATIDLTNGSDPYVMSLMQKGAPQSYDITGVCFTPGGCSISVIQE